MQLLVLGGTQFLGRAIVEHALARGHDVTCLARGTTEPHPDATFIRGDRDHVDALQPAADTTWDAVIDLSRNPIHARRAAADLQAQHWVYVSSASVYTVHGQPERDENTPTYEPLSADFMESPSEYGSAKVACEQAYAPMRHALTVIRPALIGGAGDSSGRTGYYTWRFAHPTGDDVLVPDDTYPASILDVRDLVAWILYCAQHRVVGTFNASGRATTLGEIYTLSRDITGSAATPRVLSDDNIETLGINPWMGPRSLPMWAPGEDWRWTGTTNTDAARAHGFVTRPLRETLEHTLAYEERRTEPRPAGLTDDEERQARAALDDR